MYISRLLAGVFLISLSTLILEVSLTRIFSIAQWYHFGFMVISIALFGFAASGTFLYVFPSLLKKNLEKSLPIFSILFSISAVVSFLIINQVPYDPYQLVWDNNQLAYLVIGYFLLSLPFFCAGCYIALTLTQIAKRVNVIYFSNLIGSAIGGGLVLLLLPITPEASIVLVVSIASLFSALLFYKSFSQRHWIFFGIWAIILAILLFVPFEITISPYKSINQLQNYPDSEILETRWNSFSRVDVIDSSGVRYAPGLSFEYRGRIPNQLGVTIDGDSLSAITLFKEIDELDFLNFTPLSLPYKLRENQNVLIIEPKGGIQILAALYNGAKTIQGVESNPLVSDIFSKYSKNTDVEIISDDARNFLKKTDQEFDIIVLPILGDVIGSSTSIYGLSEDYIFTIDAFDEYYDLLSENGILTATQWLQYPPKQTPRVVSIAVEALENNNVDPRNHIAIIRSYVASTILVKNSEFTSADLEKIRDFCKQRKFDLVYLPGITESEVNLYNKFPEPYLYQITTAILNQDSRSKVFDEYLFDISPVSDNNPFFLNFFRWDKTGELYESVGEKWEPFLEGGFIIIFVLVQAVVLSVVLIVLPLVVKKKTKSKVKGKKLILGYFFLIGIGFMLVEIAAIQNFVLLLGQPVFSFSIVISSLLFFSGIGSLLSNKIILKKLKWEMLVLVILILLCSFLISAGIYIFLGQDLIVRFIFSFLFLAPIGVLMGIPFPLGIRLVDEKDSNFIPWAWCSNGCASVIGSIIAALIAISFGISFVFIIAGLAYLGAMVMLLLLRP